MRRERMKMNEALNRQKAINLGIIVMIVLLTLSSLHWLFGV